MPTTPVCRHETNTPGCPWCQHQHDPSERGERFRALPVDEHGRFLLPMKVQMPTPVKPVRYGLVELPPSLRAPVRTGACRYLNAGQVLDRRGKNCSGCWVHGCELHGRCTTREAVPGIACCATCPRWQADDAEADLYGPLPPPEKTVRHLLYHIYPRRIGDAEGSTSQQANWRWNILRLRERIELFNGRRVIAIASDRTTDLAIHVQRALDGVRCEFVEVENDAALREVATHETLFSRIADLTGPEHVVLWAHAKGVTNKTWPDGGAAIRMWTQLLYEAMLDYWPLVHQVLTLHPVAGCLRRRGSYWPESSSRWHYSGSWFWFRHQDLLRRDWQRIDRFPFGIEPYPSLHFALPEAGVIFGDMEFHGKPSWPYLPEVWRNTITPQFAAWKVENEKYRLEVPCAA